MSTGVNTFQIEPESSRLAPFRRRLRSLLEQAGFDERGTQDILLSIDEVLTNVIRHGSRGLGPGAGKDKISISFSDNGDRAEILIEDRGPSFDPRRVPNPQLPSETPGGLGIYLIRSLMDEMDYEPLVPQGNRLRLVKYKKGKERNLKP